MNYNSIRMRLNRMTSKMCPIKRDLRRSDLIRRYQIGNDLIEMYLVEMHLIESDLIGNDLIGNTLELI